MAVDKQAFRDAMARLGAAVNVVTTDGPAGRYGFTASAVCSVTDDPPMLLVCVNRSNDSCGAAKANGVLCVNVLTHAQQALSPVFGGLTERAPEPPVQLRELDQHRHGRAGPDRGRRFVRLPRDEDGSCRNARRPVLRGRGFSDRRGS